MAHNSTGPMSKPQPRPLPTWWTVVFFLVVLGISWWQTRSPDPSPSATTRPTAPSRDSDNEPANQPIPAEVARESDSVNQVHSSTTQPRRQDQDDAEKSAGRSDDSNSTHPIYEIKNQKIRDQDGNVIYSGTINLKPTLERIARGDPNSHRHDGTTFQNRERRLPVKSSGYYKEFVHPTPKTSGPGPQRIIVGKDGDIWYTPDHYRTFQRIQ